MREFTPQEQEFLAQNSRNYTIKELTKMLDRSDGSIRSYLKQKKLSYKQVAFRYRTSLTEREIEVMELLSQGFTQDYIAQKLQVSRTTICTHLRTVRNKLNITQNPSYNSLVNTINEYRKARL